MSIGPVQAFKEMPTKKKVAIAAGAAAAVAVGAAAYLSGKNTEAIKVQFDQFASKAEGAKKPGFIKVMTEGFKAWGSKIAKVATDAFNGVRSFFAKKGENAAEVTENVAEKAPQA